MAIFFPNLACEYELAGLTPRATAQAQIDALTPALLALGRDGDLLWTPLKFSPSPALEQWLGGCPRVVTQPPPDGNFPLIPWGISPRLYRDPGIRVSLPPLPTLEVVGRVNHKAWSHHLEVGWGISPPGACLVSNRGELVAALTTFDGNTPWILKDPWGVAGGGRLHGQGAEPNPAQWSWIERRWLRGPLLLEPWQSRVTDYSVQVEVTKQGGVQVLGLTTLLVGVTGIYVGNGVGGPIPQEVAEPLLRVARDVGDSLFRAGYFGPAGIDAYTWRDSNGISYLRPLVEVNVRYTFGRVAVELGRHLQPGQTGTLKMVPANTPQLWRDGQGVMALTQAPVAGARVMWVWEVTSAPSPVGSGRDQHPGYNLVP